MGRLANRSLGRIPRPVYATHACCGDPNLQKGLTPLQPALPTVKGSTCETTVEEAKSCGCEKNTVKKEKMPITFSVFMGELFRTSRTLLLMFTGFAFIGYFLNSLIPSEWIVGLFGSGNFYSIPLAATLGLPLYINTEASLPLVRALLDNGMSQGAALSFLITGSGTSIGALPGALTIARWRVIAIVIGTLWLGSIALGFLYNALITLGLF